METTHYDWFLAAFAEEMKQREVQQKTIAIEIGVDPATVSRVTNKKRGANPEIMDKIAKYFGYDPLTFFDKGRRLLSGKKISMGESFPPYIVNPSPKLLPEPPQANRRTNQDNREGVLNLFADKEKAREIVLDLWEIEKNNPDKLTETGMFIKGVLIGMSSKKTGSGS